MKKLKIAIDIDDVLAENAAGFLKFSNERWGTSLTLDDYDEHWMKMWQVDKEEMERRASEFHNSSAVRGYGHVGGALESLNRLSKSHELVIATSRRLQIKQDTLLWVEEHFPGVFSSSAVYFAGIWDNTDENSHKMTKVDLIKQINADVLVDDQLKHCLAVAESGRHALIFGNYKWNQASSLPARVTRCMSWLDVEQEIEKIAKS